MPLNFAMSAMSVAESALWILLAFLFWRKKFYRRFPAMNAYLVLRVASMPVLIVLLFGQAAHWFNDYCFIAYFFAYWAVYIASAVILFYVCLEIFRAAFAMFPGLARLGTVVFQWAALASVIVSFSTIPFTHRGILMIPDVAHGMMRSVSVVELCLLAFLCLSMDALHLSVRDMVFGIAIGFGIMSANDFVQSLLITISDSLIAPWQFVYETGILVAIGTWITYCLLPEPVKLPALMPVDSTISRWNEIASALGHTGTQIAVPQPAGSFFLTDIEDVVEKVLNRTLKGDESKS